MIVLMKMEETSQMIIKKTLSTLCLLATTALAGTPTYTYYNTIDTGNSSAPSGLAFGNGDLFVALGNNTIAAFDSSGNAVTLNPAISGLSNPQGLAFSNGTLYVANAGAGKVCSYAINGATVTSSNASFINIGAGSSPNALAIFGNTLYSANGGVPNVTFYDINNLAQAYTPLTGFNSPQGMAISGNTLYVGNNQGTFRNIDVYTLSNGGATAAISTPISTTNIYPYGVAIDSQGHLYVVDQGSDAANGYTVSIYNTTDGTLVTTIGNAFGSGDYEFRAPTFATISPDGLYLYVSDTGNNRVQIFSITYVSSALLTLVGQGAMDQGMFNALSSLPMTINLTLPQATQLMHSVGNMSAAMSQISTAVGGGMGFVSSVAGTVVSTGFNAPSSSQESHFSFTARQRTAFKNLTQQLPMLQFQSLQSLVEPVVVPVNYYATTATPFEQPKMTLKPVFLSNDNHHIWIQPYGGLQRLDSYDQVTGYSLKTIGTAMGAGGKVTQNLILGVLVGGAMNSYTQDHTSGDGSVDNYYAGLYGGYAMPGSGFHVDGSIILGQSKYTGDRNLSALGLVAKNSHKGWDASGQIQTGYKISYVDFSVDPFAAVGARYSYQNAYQETNANPFNLSISSATTKTATIELGSKFQSSMMVNETMVSPMISLSAYREQPLSKQSNATMNFTDGGNSFSVPVSNQIKTFAKVTVGVASMFTNNVTISALVTGKIRKHEKSVEALVKVSYAF